jgi:hypothetical protein
MPDLPVEILGEIFAYLPSSSLRVREAHEFPWYLGKVCSRWRALFFSMRSTFWRSIEIDWYYNVEDNLRIIRLCKRVKMILPFFLNRTQGAPFSFSLFRTLGYPDEKNVRWILKDLLDHSRQWEEAFIRLRPVDFNVLRTAKGHLPLLKRLEIAVPPYHRGSNPSLAGIFKDAPLLTHVALKGILTWEFNWSSLTTFNIGGQESINKTLAILRKTVNLVELTIGSVFLDAGISGLIHFPHLEYLSICGANVLAVLDTPALRRLEILVYGDEDVVKADVTVHFLCRSRLRVTLVENKSNHTTLLHTSTIRD